MTYGNGAGGGTQLITLEHTRRGASGRFGEPERLIRVSSELVFAGMGIDQCFSWQVAQADDEADQTTDPCMA